MKLFLDDLRYPKEVKWVDIGFGHWEIVRSYDEFVQFILKNGVPDTISFDMDLCDEHYASGEPPPNGWIEKNGYDCALWLINHCIKNNHPFPEKITVHSLNQNGKKLLQELWNQYLK
jgi:hypothetical protein